MKIYSPVKDFNGLRANVRFVNGVAETDNTHLIEWFKNHGYTVEKSLEKSDESVEKSLEKSDKPDFTSMTPDELRNWMREHGYGAKIKNTKSKDKLIEIIRG